MYGQVDGGAYAQAALTNTHLLPGEQGHLIVRMHGGDADDRPAAPEVEGVAINFVRSESRINAERQIATDFIYRVTPANPGSYTIPPIAMRSKGNVHHTKPLRFTVHPISQLNVFPTGLGKHKVLTGWFPEKTKLYQGEKCPVTLKIYIPKRLPVALNGWGLPDPAKDNCLAWRFSLPQESDSSLVSIDGVVYRSATFNTTLSGIVPGTATFGPAPLRVIVTVSVIDPRLGPRRTTPRIKLTIPPISFEIIDLPDGAPDNFNGAIGQFAMVSHSGHIQLDAEEPTEVLLGISGRGNLDTMKAPVFNDKSWKIIDSTKVTRGKERRYINGVVTFRQLLRPKHTSTEKPPSAIPGYSLCYFDPQGKSYHTVTTEPIPVQIAPILTSSSKANNHNTPEKQGTAPEEMRGILGFITRPDTASPNKQIFYVWHLAPALLALFLLAIPIRKKVKIARIKHPNVIERERDLVCLAKENDQSNFYRIAGHFIERWLKNDSASQRLQENKQELDHVIERRDQLCFQSEKQNMVAIDAEDKKAVLDLLKRCTKLALCLLLFL